MKAEVRLTDDGGLMIYIPPEQLSSELYDIPPGICGCARLPATSFALAPLLGAELEAKPAPPVSLFNDYGMLGMPATIRAIMDDMQQLVDKFLPKSLMFQLVPEKRLIPKSLLQALLPAGLEVPSTFGHHSTRKFLLSEINGKRIFIGFVNENGKGILTIKGPDEKADKYVGHGNMHGHIVKIHVEGLMNPENVLQRLKGLSDITLSEVSKAHGSNST